VGLINCIKSVVASMIERNYGKIIAIESDPGRIGENNEAVYGACKGGRLPCSKELPLNSELAD